MIRLNDTERKLIIHATSQLFKKYTDMLQEHPDDIDLKVRKEEVVFANNKVAENDTIDFKTLEIITKHLRNMEGKAYKALATKFKKMLDNREIIERKLKKAQKLSV